MRGKCQECRRHEQDTRELWNHVLSYKVKRDSGAYHGGAGQEELFLQQRLKDLQDHQGKNLFTFRQI